MSCAAGVEPTNRKSKQMPPPPAPKKQLSSQEKPKKKGKPSFPSFSLSPRGGPSLDFFLSAAASLIPQPQAMPSSGGGGGGGGDGTPAAFYVGRRGDFFVYFFCLKFLT
jgi:hypothetical protein